MIKSSYPDGYRPANLFERLTGYFSWPKPICADYDLDIAPWAGSNAFWNQPIKGNTIEDRTQELHELGGDFDTSSGGMWQGTMSGLPYQVIGTSQKSTTKVWFQNITENILEIDKGTQRIPFPSAGPRRENDPNPYGDMHAIIWDPRNNQLWELTELRNMLVQANGVGWVCRGVCWDTTKPWDEQSTMKNPQGVIAARTPILPMVLRYQDIANGKKLNHLTLMSVSNYAGEIAPGSPVKGSDGMDDNSPLRSGELLRMTEKKYNEVMKSGTQLEKSVAHGYRNYGLMVSDKSTFKLVSQFHSGSARSAQDKNLAALKPKWKMSDFEVVSWT